MSTELEDEVSWRRVTLAEGSPIPSFRRYAASEFINGKMYLFGGLSSGRQAADDLWEYSPENKTWKQVEISGQKPPARGACSSAVIGGKMYVFGGMADKKMRFNDVWCFDPATAAWSETTTTGEQPSSRSQCSGAVLGNRWLIFGGSLSLKKQDGALWELTIDDTGSGRWQCLFDAGESSRSITPRAGALMWHHKARLHVLGGFAGEGEDEHLSDAYVLDLAQLTGDGSASWTELELSGALPGTGRGINGVVYEGGVFVYGGYGGGKPVGELFYASTVNPEQWKAVECWLEFDPTNVDLAATGSMGVKPTPRYGNAICLNDDTLISFGGSGSTYFNDIVEFVLPRTVPIQK
eukprot:Clim_evm9s247 gene=Clim_evmTU9s247